MIGTGLDIAAVHTDGRRAEESLFGRAREIRHGDTPKIGLESQFRGDALDHLECGRGVWAPLECKYLDDRSRHQIGRVTAASHSVNYAR